MRIQSKQTRHGSPSCSYHSQSLLFFTLTVKPEPVVQTPDRPALSEEEMERKSKSIIDEFLHINDFKVLRFTRRSTVDACLGVQCFYVHMFKCTSTSRCFEGC